MPKASKPIPYDFVLESLAPLSPRLNPMFGCQAVYVGEKIVLILRERQKPVEDDGIWLATTLEHHESLAREFPSMRSISIFGPGQTGWQVLPARAADFETAALRACELILAGDPRIGKVPKSKLSRAKKALKTKQALKKDTSEKKTPPKKASKVKRRRAKAKPPRR